MSNQVNTDLIEEALELAQTYKKWTREDNRFIVLVRQAIDKDIDNLPTLIEIMRDELDNIALKERI
jgi:hypothetical protein